MNFKNIIRRQNSHKTVLLSSKSIFIKSVLLFFIIFTSTLSLNTVFAQESSSSFNEEYLEALQKGMNQESWLNSSMDANLNGVYLKLGGISSYEKNGDEQAYLPQGAIGTVNNMIGSLFNQPISGTEYIAQVKNEFLGKPVYAQETGFKGLQPILPAWRACRNIVYSLFSIIFIIIGIMIMLRIKISPQAVITIQNSIPKIITSLILVTFSYAIAGLVIDFSKLVTPIGINLIAQAKGIEGDSVIFETERAPFSLDPSMFGGFTKFFSDLWKQENFTSEKLSNPTFSTIYKLTQNAIPAETGQLLGKVAGTIFLGVISGDTNNLISVFAGKAAGWVSKNILFPVIIAIFILIWLIKLYFNLLKCYITLIFNVIIAPFQIASGAFPSSKSGFSKWMLNIVANVSVFPITTLFLVFINFLTELLSDPTLSLWIPSQISMGDLTSQNNSIVAAGIGLAGLGMLSKLPTLIVEAVFQIKPSPFGKAISEGYDRKSIPGYKTISGGIIRATENKIGEKTYNLKDRTIGRFSRWRAGEAATGGNTNNTNGASSSARNNSQNGPRSNT